MICYHQLIVAMIGQSHANRITNFILINFSLSVSSWTSAYMGQTDPVSVFPSQQPFRKDPPGCSGVGCTGDGNPDDPVTSPLPPLPLTAMSETAPVANWWKKPQSPKCSVLVSAKREQLLCLPSALSDSDIGFTLVHWERCFRSVTVGVWTNI